MGTSNKSTGAGWIIRAPSVSKNVATCSCAAVAAAARLGMSMLVLNIWGFLVGILGF
jgi:hypothetical protein